MQLQTPNKLQAMRNQCRMCLCTECWTKPAQVITDALPELRTCEYSCDIAMSMICYAVPPEFHQPGTKAEIRIEKNKKKKKKKESGYP